MVGVDAFFSSEDEDDVVGNTDDSDDDDEDFNEGGIASINGMVDEAEVPNINSLMK